MVNECFSFFITKLRDNITDDGENIVDEKFNNC